MRFGRWARAVYAPRRLDLRATVGPDARAALRIYRPFHRRAALAVRVGAPLLARGIAPRSPPPLDARGLASTVGIDATAAAVMRSSHGGRLVAGLAHDAALTAVVKLGPEGDEGLEREVTALETVRGGPAFRVPTLLHAGRWDGRSLVATRGVAVDRPILDTEEALAVSVALTTGLTGAGPIVHGDFAPWNVLRSGPDVVLVDWEGWRAEPDPLFDLANFVTQRGQLLGLYEPDQAVVQLTAPGSPGWRYLERVGLDPARAPELLIGYLERTAWFSDERGHDYRRAMGEIVRARG